MNDLLKTATAELERFLSESLPKLSDEWWTKHVIDRLSFQQQRLVQERRFTALRDLDFAALLRVLDQNWFELSNSRSLPKEGRNWVKELQTVRNKWAHLSSHEVSSSEIYRDADTLGRMLVMIGASVAALEKIEAFKANAVALLASKAPSKSIEPSTTPLHAPSSGHQSGVEESHAIELATTSQGNALFAVGNLVTLRSNPSVVMPIVEVIAATVGESRYRVFQNNGLATYYESQLQTVSSVEPEQTQLTAEAVHAYLTSLQLLAPSTANLYSLRSGRVKFIPYQYRPVLKLIRADRPRLLIADEVGVGKTIEAGLIIKELQARMELSSVLIICPKALVAERKWFVEMKRFEEQFTALDGPLLRHCLQETHLDGEWPDQYSKAIIPFSLFDKDLVFGPDKPNKKHLGLIKLDPPPKFDLVIVDEAHHIRNSETYLHQGVRYFCDNADAVVFLSATPIQLGRPDLFTLLNVLRPDLIIDHASFEQMAAPNGFINAAVRHCRQGQQGWASDARSSLDEAAQTEWGRLFIRETPAFQQIYDQLQQESLSDTDRVTLTRSIEELYTFSNLINRTRRRDIGEFTVRKAETLTVEFTDGQKEVHDTLLDIVARILAFCHGDQNVKFMMTTIRRQAASCLYGLVPLLEDMLLGKLDKLEVMEAAETEAEVSTTFGEKILADVTELLTKAKQLDSHDPKVEAFIRTLVEKQVCANNKAIVFSTFRHTLKYLAEHVEQAGLRYGLVHGGVPDEERSEVRHRFALPKDDPQALDIMLSSEVGCEGLDFQFCDFLVNYDLPWNPMRIEQRIGRIDRYGQPSPSVVIVNLITPGTVDAEIYERCLMRIGVFQHAIGGNEEILGEITQELKRIEESFELTDAERAAQLKQLADNGIRQLNEEQELESKQAELFGLNIPNQKWQKEIEAAENYWLAPPALQQCVASYLANRLGKDQDYLLGEKPLKTLRLSLEARSKLLDDFKRLPRTKDPVAREWEKWLKGTTPTLSITFDQTAAVETPPALHLSVTHPLLRQAALHLKLDTTANTALEVEASGIAPGDYRFGIYRWSKQGVKPDEELVAIADDPAIEQRLFTLLQSAKTRPNAAQFNPIDFETLDAQHHSKWSTARANHEAENRQLVEYRIHSLNVSHQARCHAIEDQLERATNDKIRLMKQGELDRANADFARRIENLNMAASSGDIHASPVAIGTIRVE